MLNGFLFRTLRLNPATVRSCIASGQRLSFSSTQDNSLVRRVKHLAQESDERLLTVSWNDGTTNRYPFLYLRDICKCPECFHQSSMQRAFDSVAELDSGLIAAKVLMHEDGKKIKLIWPNKHETIFDADWLYERRLPEENGQHTEKENSFVDEGIQLGDHTLSGNIPALHFNDVLNSKETQIKWLELIRCHGIVVIKGASNKADQVKKLGGILGYILPMWFGDSILVENDVEKDNEGVSLSSLPEATCAYNEYRGGLHLIHCLKEVFGSGGEHMFVDGFNVAKQLKDTNAEAFRLLCTSNIMYQRKVANKEAEFDMKFTRPMISVDFNGRIKRMIYNDTSRVTFVNATPEEIPKLYRVCYEVGQMIRDPMNTISYKLQTGDIITYDCDRVFSGRKPFGPGTKGTEVFEIGFTDKDMTNSRRKTLKID